MATKNNKNNFKKIICFDLDNTLCNTAGSDYENSKPIKNKIKFVNSLYDQNYYILIFTARYMGKFKGKRSKVVSFGYKKTLSQIKSWGLKFNSLEMGKPSYDYIIDDKCIFFKKNWIKKINHLLNEKY